MKPRLLATRSGRVLGFDLKTGNPVTDWPSGGFNLGFPAADGTVSQAKGVGPSGPERLDVAAANFVKGYWRWQPPTRAGKPVTTNTRVSVLFRLAKPAAPVAR